MNKPSNTFVFLGDDGRVEFGYYSKESQKCDELTFRKIPRGALSFSGSDAEILVATEHGFIKALENGPGQDFAMLGAVIEGVERLRQVIQHGRRANQDGRN